LSGVGSGDGNGAKAAPNSDLRGCIRQARLAERFGWTSPFIKGTAEEIMRFRGGPGSKDPSRIDYSGATLKMLLKRAYDVQPDQIEGPDWLDTERYDISAKLPPETNAKQFRLMCCKSC
jgi:Protein of unknown function (DUF3738)